MSDPRRCAACGGPMVRGQRAVGGSRESERQFALRKFCSMRCAMREQQRRQNAAVRLQALVDGLRRPEHGELVIEFHGAKGWLLRGDARSLSDDGGDFAGRTWREAERFIKWFLA